MNVALLLDTLTGGGAEGVVRRLAVGLVGCGHRAFIYCLKTAETPLAPLQDAGVIVREARSVGRDPFLALRLGRWLAADGIDVVHAHSCSALFWALPSARLRGLPLIHVRHGALLGRPSRYRRLADRFDCFVDRVVVVSESDRAALRAGRLARAAVRIPNGIDLAPMSAPEARALLQRHCRREFTGPIVLGVGTVCPEKDVAGLLRAFATLRRSLPAATLVWVGPERGGDYGSDVRRQRAALGLQDHVVLAGPFEDAWRLMAGADVFCLSSATEALPNVIVEAMSQRVPIVATMVGDVGRSESARHGHELVRHGESGLLVPPRDPDALAEALRDALANPGAARARAARAAEDYARLHTGAQMVRRYEQVYVDCLRRRGRSATPRARIPRERQRRGVLMLGPGSAQIGGMTSVIDALMASPLREKYSLHRFVPSSAASAAHARRAALRECRPAPVLSAVARHTGDLLRLARTIRRQRIGIVHIHTCSFISFFRSLLDLGIAKLLGCRGYLHVHGAKFDEFCADSGPLVRGLIRRGCEAADGVIVLSKRWVETLRPYLGTARIVAIPNGAAPSATSPARVRSADDRCRFLFLGALVERKGVAELLEAAARLRQADTPFELLLAGPATGADRRRWERLVRSRHLEQVVTFTGAVRGPAKAELLASADCLVLPSHNEGLPVAILEAANAGLPVISTTVGSIPEFMTPEDPAAATVEGFLSPLVSSGDVDGLARQMMRLAGGHELRRRIGDRLRAHVAANYSVARQAERIARLYEAPPVCAARDALSPSGIVNRGGRTVSEWVAGKLTYPLHEASRGRETLACYREIRRVSAAPRDALQRECAARLRDLLAFARNRLPYYRELFAKHGVNPEGADPYGELARLPALTKTDVRANAEGMIDRDVPGGLSRCDSGGTSGDTLRFFIDRTRAAQPLGCRLFMQSLFGVQPGDRRVYLWGSPIEASPPRFKRWRDRLINELMLDAFDLGPAAVDAHLEAIRAFQPRLIYGYPSAVALLAKRAAARHSAHDFRRLRLVVLTGEEIASEHTDPIRAAFGCPIASEYGSREVGLIAHDCPQGSLHILSPHVHVEIARDGRPVAPGEAGEVLCTTLTTRGQPFVRYRLGDAGALVPGPCPCGLPLPRMRIIGGRVSGFVVLPDNRLCYGAVSSYALRGEPGIVEFKTYQRALDRFEVLLVVDQDFDVKAVDRIQWRYRVLFGRRVRATCRIVDRIEPDPSGKRRHVVSCVDPASVDFSGLAMLEPGHARVEAQD